MNKKHYNIIFSCLSAIIISVPMAFVMVVMNVGFIQGFFIAFLKSALVSVAISIPLAAVGIPLAKRITDSISWK